MIRFGLLLVLYGILAAAGVQASQGTHPDTVMTTRSVSCTDVLNRSVSWDDLPEYQYRSFSPFRLGIVLCGVAVYDVAFYQTLKKPWWNGTKSDFHFVQDWWGNYALEVDKFAHAWAGQAGALIAARSYEWTGMSHRQALFWGGVTSLATLTQVEILDAYTERFGFSPGDYTANIVGSFFPLVQDLWHPLQNVSFKMSYHPARFERNAYRGRSEPNRLEDYSRQTFWLAFNVHNMMPIHAWKYWPSWLQVAVGYGVDNAFAPVEEDRIREFYLALDFDPSRIDTRHGWLKSLLSPFRYLHLPAPAIRFRRDGTKAFVLYF